MIRRRIAIVAGCAVLLAVATLVSLWAAYHSARQVRPFYQQAMQLDATAIDRGRQEMESRAATLYSDVRSATRWQAVFTADQVNGWLAGELSPPDAEADAAAVRQPRIAFSPGVVTLGFSTRRGGVETVISVDAGVFLTDDRDVAVRIDRVRAGSLPLPAALITDELSAAFRRLPYPVFWVDQGGSPAAVIKLSHDPASDAPEFTIDTIELSEGELYVAGRTEFADPKHRLFGGRRPSGADLGPPPNSN